MAGALCKAPRPSGCGEALPPAMSAGPHKASDAAALLVHSPPRPDLQGGHQLGEHGVEVGEQVVQEAVAQVAVCATRGSREAGAQRE